MRLGNGSSEMPVSIFVAYSGRRALVLFVLVPRHVAAKHGRERKADSMLKNLQQAHDAFVFWARLMQRSQ